MPNLFIFAVITSLFHSGTVRQVTIFGRSLHSKTFKYHEVSYFYCVSMGREAMLKVAKEHGGE